MIVAAFRDKSAIHRADEIARSARGKRTDETVNKLNVAPRSIIRYGRFDWLGMPRDRKAPAGNETTQLISRLETDSSISDFPTFPSPRAFFFSFFLFSNFYRGSSRISRPGRNSWKVSAFPTNSSNSSIVGSFEEKYRHIMRPRGIEFAIRRPDE